MQVARIVTNETCNQNCGFCDVRRAAERASVAGAAAVRAGVDQALALDIGVLVLTGGEPTLRRDLPSIAAYAKRGAEVPTLILESNAVLIDADRAAALRDAGVDLVRVQVPAWGPRCDRVTRDPGGFAHTRAGLDALARAGMALEISVPVVRANADVITEIPAAIAASGLPIRRIAIVMPAAAPDPSTLLDLDQAARAVEALVVAAADSDVAVQLAKHTFIPPCAFQRPGRVAHIFAMSPGGAEEPGHRRAPTCDSECAVADRCPGIPAALRAGPRVLSPAPIADDRVRRRLSIMSSVEDQIARELVSPELYRLDDGTLLPAHTIRINFQCNQACEFCFVSTHLPPAPEAAVGAAILEIAHAGGVLVISGGEPTLNPKLLDYVRLGSENGARFVELQTNAIRLAEGTLAAQLAAAGVTDALVSLHAAEAATSDAITRAPGTFERSARGIDALARTGIRVRLNFVFCAANHQGFPQYVELMAERWPGTALTVSFVAGSTDLVPRTRQLLPRYSDVLPHLAAGLDRARAAGIEVTGLHSMCGLPLCLVPGDETRRGFFELAEIPEGFDRGEFVKTETCRQCGLVTRCFGIRRGYVELYGSDELVAVPGSGTSSSS